MTNNFNLLPEEIVYAMREQFTDIDALSNLRTISDANEKIVDRFIRGEEGAQWTIIQFDKNIASNSQKCLEIVQLAVISKATEAWKNMPNNPFALLAWLLTCDDLMKETLSFEQDKQLGDKLHAAIKFADISNSLAVSVDFTYQMINYRGWHDEHDEHVGWNYAYNNLYSFREQLNKKINYHNVKYINLQGINLVDTQLSYLKLPANLRKANLQGADFSKTDLRGAYLKGATISEDQLQQAILDETTEYPF